MKNILTYIFLVLMLHSYYSASVRYMQLSVSLEQHDGNAAESEIIDEMAEEGLEDDTELGIIQLFSPQNSTLCRESFISCWESAHYPITPPPPEV